MSVGKNGVVGMMCIMAIGAMISSCGKNNGSSNEAVTRGATVNPAAPAAPAASAPVQVIEIKPEAVTEAQALIAKADAEFQRIGVYSLKITNDAIWEARVNRYVQNDHNISNRYMSKSEEVKKVLQQVANEVKNLENGRKKDVFKHFVRVIANIAGYNVSSDLLIQ